MKKIIINIKSQTVTNHSVQHDRNSERIYIEDFPNEWLTSNFGIRAEMIQGETPYTINAVEEGNEYYFPVPAQITNNPDATSYSVTVYASGTLSDTTPYQDVTPHVMVEMKDTEWNGEVIAPEKDVSAITTLLNAMTIANKEEGIRQEREQERKSAEDTREKNEVTRKANEGYRQDEERKREQNETARKQSEISRASAERDRETAETSREQAENERNTAEGIRANSEIARVVSERTRAESEDTREKNESKRENTMQAWGNTMATWQSRMDNMQSDINAQNLTVSQVKSLVDTLDGTVSNVTAELNNKVDKVEGKGLSQEDFTTDYKNKLQSIESGAEKNVQSDWLAEPTTPAGIKNKPDLSVKADKATTLAGYGITDAYTVAEIDNKIGAIDSALDSIIAMQNSLIGGGTV